MLFLAPTLDNADLLFSLVITLGFYLHNVEVVDPDAGSGSLITNAACTKTTNAEILISHLALFRVFTLAVRETVETGATAGTRSADDVRLAATLPAKVLTVETNRSIPVTLTWKSPVVVVGGKGVG